jgi:hypothetical protein
MVASRLTTEHVKALVARGRWDLLRKYHRSLTPLARFQPRPDSPEEFDEQTAFLNSKATFSVAVGGNGSGKTICAAVKTARYVLETRPHRDNCPFWILGETFEQTCATCWDEKLCSLIPKNRIRHIHWHIPARNWPRAVMLRHPDDPNRTGWVLEFKSYDQGASLMQGRSIGGYWFNEECPLDIVEEVQVRCRDYDSPGWADFTPIHIRDARWADLYDEPRPGWQFFRMNVLKNNTGKVQEWASKFLQGLPEDERETRTTGAFAGFSGQVFKEFVRKIHVISSKSKGIEGDIAAKLERHELPPGWFAIRGLDFGWSNPLACMWIAKDPDGRYYVFDEHFESQKPIEYHAQRMGERTWKYNNPHYGPTYCDNEDPRGIDHLNRLAGVDDKKRPYFIPVNKSDRLGVQISYLRSLMMVQGDERPKLYVLAKCENLIRELRAYKWQEPIEGKRKRNPQDIPVQWDDHAIDAMRYAIWHDSMGARSKPESISQGYSQRESIRFSGRR